MLIHRSVEEGEKYDLGAERPSRIVDVSLRNPPIRKTPVLLIPVLPKNNYNPMTGMGL